MILLIFGVGTVGGKIIGHCNPENGVKIITENKSWTIPFVGGTYHNQKVIN